VKAAAVVVALGVIAFAQTPPAREVAVTFDDLPVAGVMPRDASARRTLTANLLRAITAHHVPVVAFVNENKLSGRDGQDGRDGPDGREVRLLEMWLDAGVELGNHTYSHLDLNTTPLAEFEADVLKGETVLRPLLKERGAEPRFFRHPFLHTGRDLDKRKQFDAFLAEHRYRVAPVTIDNDDYIFAWAYDRAAMRGDPDLMRRVAAAYVPYMEAKFAFFERNSTELFGREMRQILLIHANAINADEFDRLAQMIERRGYRFITLDRALEDPAYHSADTYVGPAGITWLHRWALTKGMPRAFYQGEPDVPPFVAENARP